MERRKNLTLWRLVLVLAAVFWLVGQCLAQMQAGGKSSAQTSRYRTPLDPSLRMRSMTMAQRKAAAARNAARRAAALQKSQSAATSQGEVKK
jgi:hypothetical protein